MQKPPYLIFIYSHPPINHGGEGMYPWLVLVTGSLLFSCCHVWLFVTPRTEARQAPLSSVSQGLLKFMSIELVILSNHLVLCCPLLLLPSIFPSVRVFSNESALCIRWPKYWSFSISPSNEYSGLISWTGLISLQSKGLSRVFSNTTVSKGAQPSLWSNSHIHT